MPLAFANTLCRSRTCIPTSCCRCGGSGSRRSPGRRTTRRYSTPPKTREPSAPTSSGSTSWGRSEIRWYTRTDVMLEDVDLFQHYRVLHERDQGLVQLVITD